MFREINIRELNESAVKLFDSDWALLTAGNTKEYNTMTVSWGALGELWGEDVAIVFVRPSRYTYEFIEKEDSFTLSFFGGNNKKELGFCGTKSGRDYDKAKETGLIPFDVNGSVAFEQAQIILKMKKIAFYDIDKAGFLDSGIDANYNGSDYHIVYIGRIEKTLKRA
jgi:flavin reductase (DIM6/NTAB) family NADH-FMN oxidoreductase RutF